MKHTKKGFKIGDHVETTDEFYCGGRKYYSGIIVKIKSRPRINKLIDFKCEQTNKILCLDESWLQPFKGDNMINRIEKFLKAVEKEFGVTSFCSSPDYQNRNCISLYINNYHFGEFNIQNNTLCNFSAALYNIRTKEKLEELWANTLLDANQKLSPIYPKCKNLVRDLENKFKVHVKQENHINSYKVLHNGHQCGFFTIYDSQHYNLEGMFSYPENRKIFKKIWDEVFNKCGHQKKPKQLYVNNDHYRITICKNCDSISCESPTWFGIRHIMGYDETCDNCGSRWEKDVLLYCKEQEFGDLIVSKLKSNELQIHSKGVILKHNKFVNICNQKS